MSDDAIAHTKVPVGGILRDVLLALDLSGLGVALVVDARDRLVGIMTDGDARRSLLAGRTLESKIEPLMKRSFVAVAPSAGRAEVLDLMQARRIDVVPIVDDTGRLRGCHQLHDVLGVHERPNAAVIMAGGRGTRLGSLTEDLPKPMIRVAGRPILERIVLHLVGYGVRRIFLSVNYLGHKIEEHFGDGSELGCTIHYLREPAALGTAGSLSLLPEPPTHPVVVMNGDLVTQADVGALLDAHASVPNAAMTMGVRRYVHTVPFGCVTADDGRVTSFEEKPTLSRLISAGIYVLEPELVRSVPCGERVDMPDVVAKCLARGRTIQTFEVVDDWIDVGQKEQLSQARGDSA